MKKFSIFLIIILIIAEIIFGIYLFNNKNNNSNTTISEAENTNQTKNVQTEDKSFTLISIFFNIMRHFMP